MKSIRLILLTLLFWAPQAWSYQDVMDTGELLEPGQFRAMLEPQLMFTKENGGEVIGRFDSGLTDSTNVRAILGTGVIDFETGVFVKWIPIPDYDKQPAIGIETGVTYVRYDGEPETSLRLHPIISKRLESTAGVWTPYASIPIAIAARKNSSLVPIHLAAGSQFQSNEWKSLQFMGEVGVNIQNSYSYISLAALFYFDESKGFKLK